MENLLSSMVQAMATGVLDVVICCYFDVTGPSDPFRCLIVNPSDGQIVDVSIAEEDHKCLSSSSFQALD